MDLRNDAISRADCLRLIATTDFAHLALTRRALPTVVPAHYHLRPDHLIIHTLVDQHPARWKDGEVVALHVDAFEAHHRSGWSITFAGAAHALDPRQLEHLARAPWLPPDAGTVIALSTDLVWGQHFAATTQRTQSP